MSANRRARPLHGFTLIELLIVVVILAVLASVVIGSFSRAADDSRQSTLQNHLQQMRRLLMLYRHEHQSQWPSLNQFERQMTGLTNPAGQPVDETYQGSTLGPYLNSIPKNPHTQDNDVTDQAPGESGWYYDEDSGDFHANDSAENRDL